MKRVKNIAKSLALEVQVGLVVLGFYLYFLIINILNVFEKNKKKTPSQPTEQTLLSNSRFGNIRSLMTDIVSATTVDVLDEEHNTPLLLAAKHGQLYSAIILLKSGANINHANRYGLTALMLAVLNDHYPTFYYLLTRKSNILLYAHTGNTVLQWAIGRGRLEMLELLIDRHHVDLNNKYQEGYTLLMNAVFSNQLEVVKWLLKQGSPLDALNEKGESALTLAKKYRKKAISAYLEQELARGDQIYNNRLRLSQSLMRLRLSLLEANYNAEKLFASSLNHTEKKTNQQIIPDDFAERPIQQESKQKSTQRLRLPKEKLQFKQSLFYQRRPKIHKAEKVTVSPAEISDIIEESDTQSVVDQTNLENSVICIVPVRTLEIVLPDAVEEIMFQLEQLGFQVFLVGGCVRDMLLKNKITDFDMICNAPTQLITEHISLGVFSKYIPNLYKIFLPTVSIDLLCMDTLNLEIDAKRRDFTCNALYVNRQHQLLDPLKATGVDDVLQRKIVTIGDPPERFQEDPIRLLRAVRLMGQHQFIASDMLKKEIRQNSLLLRQCLPGKLQYELRKVFLRGFAVNNYQILKELVLLPNIFTDTAPALFQEPQVEQWILSKLAQTDAMVKLSQNVSIYYVLAIFKVAPAVLHTTNPSALEKEIAGKQIDPKLYQFFSKTDRITTEIIHQLHETPLAPRTY